jgi:hypothetical protein
VAAADLPQRGKRGVQLAAGADAELDEDLAQVPFDRAGGQEKLGADLRIRHARLGQLRDLVLLGSELVACPVGPPPDRFSGGQQFAAGPLGEGLHADRTE